MFTGIIQAQGIMTQLARQGEEAALTIATDLPLNDVRIGDSIAVNGVCLTVTAKISRGFTADVSAETLARTNLGQLRTGAGVNLEKSLRLTDFLGGHLVLGHVDGLGRIAEKTVRTKSILFAFEVPEALVRYIVEKGSVAVDGVSLTVNRCERNRFHVNMIPHTAQATTLGTKRVSDLVNIETDIIGKYVERLMLHNRGDGPGVDWKFLAEHGFLR
ncbi:MAG TPA: riboflavin synthase [Syntrophales bacterium]|jgi:riboflavin synthase|nr:riboflavin synthase [Syntrophales bacterium]HOU78292.1 riboflavin synthase [Syntrophales bacterium]HPC33576.1 riboflavin synthase [Syntrophales bacterium]HQG34987.1 riboflavin synthase [Syntrophales bacterium]HQI36631.1 riboflavin synthase [Syntrophales bacterium]